VTDGSVEGRQKTFVDPEGVGLQHSWGTSWFNAPILQMLKPAIPASRHAALSVNTVQTLLIH